MSAVNGFHTPALQAMTPRLVGPGDQASVAALMSLKGTSAAIWGAAIVGLGFANGLFTALLCLALAGAADMASGVFRMTIWNETIPTELRGRLAGIEQLSYMSGPLLGNARAGLMAERFGLMPSIWWGGLLCVGGMAACRVALPQFWKFRKG